MLKTNDKPLINTKLYNQWNNICSFIPNKTIVSIQ